MSNLEIGFWVAVVLEIIFACLWLSVKIKNRKLRQEIDLRNMSVGTVVEYKYAQPLVLQTKVRFVPEYGRPVDENMKLRGYLIQKAKQELLLSAERSIEILHRKPEAWETDYPDTEDFTFILRVYEIPK